jgi:hypothetical protein
MSLQQTEGSRRERDEEKSRFYPHRDLSFSPAGTFGKRAFEMTELFPLIQLELVIFSLGSG